MDNDSVGAMLFVEFGARPNAIRPRSPRPRRRRSRQHPRGSRPTPTAPPSSVQARPPPELMDRQKLALTRPMARPFAVRGERRIPVHGGEGTAGVLNAQSRFLPAVGGYVPYHGSSYIQVVTFDEKARWPTRCCPIRSPPIRPRRTTPTDRTVFEEGRIGVLPIKADVAAETIGPALAGIDDLVGRWPTARRVRAPRTWALAALRPVQDLAATQSAAALIASRRSSGRRRRAAGERRRPPRRRRRRRGAGSRRSDRGSRSAPAALAFPRTSNRWPIAARADYPSGFQSGDLEAGANRAGHVAGRSAITRPGSSGWRGWRCRRPRLPAPIPPGAERLGASHRARPVQAIGPDHQAAAQGRIVAQFCAGLGDGG